jgi:hypothetical protein
MATDHLSKLNPDGTTMGQTAADKVGFYGATPIAQRTNAAQTAITDGSTGTANPATGVAALTATYNSTLLINALATIIAQTNEFRTALVNIGLIKGS